MQPVSPSGSTSGPTLALNVEKLDELRRANDIGSDAKLARLIGVDTSTLFRVRNGQTPSTRFIAGVKIAFPTVSLDALFNIVDTESVAS
jgi:hypothetical protein